MGACRGGRPRPAGGAQPGEAARARGAAARSGDSVVARGKGSSLAGRGGCGRGGGQRSGQCAADDGQPAGRDARVPARARGGGAHTARRARPGLIPLLCRSSGAGQGPHPSGRLRGARLWPRVAVLVGDDWVPPAHDRSRAGHRARASARGRDAGRLRTGRAACLCDRQHRRLPSVRLAASAQADRARLPPGVPDRAAGHGPRPDHPGTWRRALPGPADGHGCGPVLVRLDDGPRRLVRLREGHARCAGDARHQPARGLPGRAHVRCRAGRPHALRGLAPSGTGER
jgi:hypothetical protein